MARKIHHRRSHYLLAFVANTILIDLIEVIDRWTASLSYNPNVLVNLWKISVLIHSSTSCLNQLHRDDCVTKQDISFTNGQLDER